MRNSLADWRMHLKVFLSLDNNGYGGQFASINFGC
jgi:hypothetical protein